MLPTPVSRITSYNVCYTKLLRVVAAIQNLWLAARARGLGLGMISIVDPAEVRRVCEVPEAWDLVAYLCLGHPEEEHADPELVRAGWQDRIPMDRVVFRR